MTQWFRWYGGTTEDAKFRVAARNADVTVGNVIALWAFMLEDASNDQHRGTCHRKEDFMAATLDLEAGDAERILGAMQDLGMIEVGPNSIEILNWQKRQFETDPKDGTNAERQRRFRERRKAEARNGGVTAAKRPETETETETETEKKEDSAPSGAASADVVNLDPSTAYAFEDGIIRLTEKDFELWKRSFSALDVPAELVALSHWAESVLGPKKWFHPVKNALAKKNREVLAQRDAASRAPVFRTLSGMDGIV